jgi:hypothetical protein
VAAERDAAIQEFAESADIDRRVLEAISKVLAKSPRAILIAWEDDTSFGLTSIPFSRSLIKGMVDTAFDAVFGDEEVPEASPDDD